QGAGAPKGALGFSYRIPRRYQDGHSHILSLVLPDGSPIMFPGAGTKAVPELRFRFEASDSEVYEAALGTGDKDTSAEPPGGSGFAGCADPLKAARVTGWAVSRNAPGQQVRLRIFM